MSVSTALGAVSSSLRNLLLGEMDLNPAVPVTILAPDETGGERRVNIFLYKVEENPFLKNLDYSLKPGNSSQLVPTPLALNLYYLLTPYAKNDSQTGNASAHEILGEAMRVLYENSIIPATYLDPDLANAREHLRIVYNAFDPEELSRLWTTFAQPFRLSVRYLVSTVQLDMSASQEKPLPKRVRTIGVPGVRAPWSPPVVTGMTPASGGAGTVITFAGESLAEWRASVQLGDAVLLDKQALAADTFTATVPAGTQVGFYDVRVDISRLFRRSFLFEVTP